MSRVIQDSDDELEDDLEVVVRQPERIEVPPKQSTSDASSTEALRGQIAAAHRAHLQSQFSIVNISQTPVTVDGNHQKRNVHTESDSNSVSTGNSVIEKSSVDYGKKPKGVFSNLPVGQAEDLSSSHQTPEPATTANGMTWMLEGTMREAYIQHNPNAMFSEPSSTVPNATLTQQRILEGVLAPALLGSDIDIGRAPFQREASIPWSEYLKSPTNTGEQPRSSTQEPHVSQNMLVALSNASPQRHPEPLQSQRDPQGSLTLAGSTPMHDSTFGAINVQELTIFPNDEHHSNDKQTQAIFPSTANSHTHEKLPSASGKLRKKRPSPMPTSKDDQVDLGLSKEQYNPRPSRSKSLKVGTQESTDHLMIPEKATKVRKRRRTTPATTHLNNLSTTPKKVRQICDMGFTPSTSIRALKHNNGDIIQSVDWLITNKIADDELVADTSQMSNAGDHKTAVHTAGERKNDIFQANHVHEEQVVAKIAATDSDAMKRDAASVQPETNVHVDNNRSPAKVQVVIPTKSPKTSVNTSTLPEISRKKAKRRKTTSDLPDPAAKDNAVPEEQIEKKQGRCRHKKVAKASLPTESIQNNNEGDSQKQVHSSPLRLVHGNVHSTTALDKAIEHGTAAIVASPGHGTSTPRSEDTSYTTVTSRSTPEPSALPDRPEVEPLTPEVIKKPAPYVKPTTNKGKIPHRVGLSKRARITPLLRIVKK